MEVTARESVIISDLTLDRVFLLSGKVPDNLPGWV